METQLPPLAKGAQHPQFSAHIRCGQTSGWITMPLGMEVGFDPADFVLDGDPAPASKKGAQQPPISAYVYYGQTAGWIKMALGTQLGLGPVDIVLDGYPAPPERGTAAPALFSP